MDPIFDKRTGVTTGGGFMYDLYSERQKTRRETSNNLLEQMAPKVLADAKSIGFDGVDQQALLDQFNSNQNINQEISPKYVKKMGVHRRNKTAGNAGVLTG